jgi:hypothetical protein
MDEGPILNEALGFGEAIPDPKPRAVCDVYGPAHQWQKATPIIWICACGEATDD